MRSLIIVLSILVSSFCPPGAASAQVTVKDRLADGQPTVVAAHRSAVMGGFPENTLGWLQYAITRGVDAVHINPQKTADGHYVLMHDNTLNRMTDVEEVFPKGPAGGPTRAQQGGRDYLGYYTLAEIKRLHVVGGEVLPDQEVPTLEEALDFVGRQAIILLGLKSYDTPTIAMALQGRDTGNVLLFELFVSGTDQSGLRQLAETTGLGVNVALYQSRDYLADLNAIHDQIGRSLRGVHVRSSGLTPQFLSRMEELGIHLFISGWDGAEDFALIEEGDPGPWKAAFATAAGVLTDQPDAVLKLLGR